MWVRSQNKRFLGNYDTGNRKRQGNRDKYADDSG